MEMEEARRLHEEKQRDLEPIGENEHIEWDGLRRRRTTLGTNPSLRSRGDSTVHPFPAYDTTVQTPRQHPPLGMSHFPTESDADHDEERPNTANIGSFIGSIRERAKSMVVPGQNRNLGSGTSHVQSPMHPVPLTEISVLGYKGNEDGTRVPYYGHDGQGGNQTYNLPLGHLDQKTEYDGAGGQRERHITIVDDETSGRTGSRGSSVHPSSGPTPPPHSAKRQFSFQNVFRKGQQPPPIPYGDEQVPPSRSPMIRKGLGARKHSGGSAVKGATEEERLGLVKGDTSTGRQPTVPPYEEEDDSYDDLRDDKYSPHQRQSPERAPRRDLTPPRRDGKDHDKEVEAVGGGSGTTSEEEYYEQQRKKWDGKQQQAGERGPPPPFDEGKGGNGAFI